MKEKKLVEEFIEDFVTEEKRVSGQLSSVKSTLEAELKNVKKSLIKMEKLRRRIHFLEVYLNQDEELS